MKSINQMLVEFEKNFARISSEIKAERCLGNDRIMDELLRQQQQDVLQAQEELACLSKELESQQQQQQMYHHTF